MIRPHARPSAATSVIIAIVLFMILGLALDSLSSVSHLFLEKPISFHESRRFDYHNFSLDDDTAYSQREWLSCAPTGGFKNAHISRLAIIISVYENIDFSPVWKDWIALLSQAYEVRFFVHSKSTREDEKVPGAECINATRISTVSTEYLYLGNMICHATYEVLENWPEVQGCIYASGSCVPIRNPNAVIERCPVGFSILNFFHDNLAAAHQWCYLELEYMRTLAFSIGDCPDKYGIRIKGRDVRWGTSACQEEHLLAAVARFYNLPVCHGVTTFVIWSHKDLPLGYDILTTPSHVPCEFVKLDPYLLHDLSQRTLFFRKVVPTVQCMQVLRDYFRDMGVSTRRLSFTFT